MALENHTKKSHFTTMRAKRAWITFWLFKIVHLASFLKTEVCGPTVSPDRSILIGQKLMKNARIEKYTWDIFNDVFKVDNDIWWTKSYKKLNITYWPIGRVESWLVIRVFSSGYWSHFFVGVHLVIFCWKLRPVLSLHFWGFFGSEMWVFWISEII